jgi:hypothetical protein
MASAPPGAGSTNMGWVAPAIMAGGQVAGAAIGGKGAGKAADATLKAQRESLAYAKEQEAQRRLMYAEAKKQYDQQVADWYASKNALLKNLGSDVSLGGGGMPAMPMGGAPGPAQPTAAAPLRASSAHILRETGALEGVYDWDKAFLGPRGA